MSALGRASFAFVLAVVVGVGCERQPETASTERPAQEVVQLAPFTGRNVGEVWAHKGPIIILVGDEEGPLERFGSTDVVKPEPDGWTYFWVKGDKKEDHAQRKGDRVRSDRPPRRDALVPSSIRLDSSRRDHAGASRPQGGGGEGRGVGRSLVRRSAVDSLFELPDKQEEPFRGQVVEVVVVVEGFFMRASHHYDPNRVPSAIPRMRARAGSGGTGPAATRAARSGSEADVSADIPPP